jgi:hypothetical protein
LLPGVACTSIARILHFKCAHAWPDRNICMVENGEGLPPLLFRKTKRTIAANATSSWPGLSGRPGQRRPHAGVAAKGTPFNF